MKHQQVSTSSCVIIKHVQPTCLKIIPHLSDQLSLFSEIYISISAGKQNFLRDNLRAFWNSHKMFFPCELNFDEDLSALFDWFMDYLQYMSDANFEYHNLCQDGNIMCT